MRRLTILVVLLSTLTFAWAQTAGATSYTVTTPADLQAKLAIAVCGDTIKLSNQVWDALQLQNHSYSCALGTGVTIKPVTGAIVRGADMDNTAGFVFLDLAFDGNACDCDIIYDTPTGTSGTSNFTVTHVTFTNAKGFIHLHGSVDMTVQRSYFGTSSTNNAVIVVEPNPNFPHITGNVFKDNLFVNKAVGTGHKGIWVKVSSNINTGYPPGVQIINNTFDTTGTGVGIDDNWAFWPTSVQPIVANNAMRSYGTPGRGQLFSNVAESGTAETGMVIGPLNLNADESPSASSTLLIDLANTTYAPAKDYFNNFRVRGPDIGAIEYPL